MRGEKVQLIAIFVRVCPLCILTKQYNLVTTKLHFFKSKVKMREKNQRIKNPIKPLGAILFMILARTSALPLKALCKSPLFALMFL